MHKGSASGAVQHSFTARGRICSTSILIIKPCAWAKPKAFFGDSGKVWGIRFSIGEAWRKKPGLDPWFSHPVALRMKELSFSPQRINQTLFPTEWIATQWCAIVPMQTKPECTSPWNMKRAILHQKPKVTKSTWYYWLLFSWKYLSQKTIIFGNVGQRTKTPRETCVALAEQQRQSETWPVVKTLNTFRVFSHLLLWALLNICLWFLNHNTDSYLNMNL